MYKCITNLIYDQNDGLIDLCAYITIGKIYNLSNNPPCSEWVINIIDDRNRPHDMNKDLFININELRDNKLKQLGI
jgi:hypothetical protein